MTASNNKKRWREIGRAMADDPGWRDGVQALALEIHHVVERMTPQELSDFADDVTTNLFERFAEQFARKGLTPSESELDDLASGMFAAALDMVDSFPARGSLS